MFKLKKENLTVISRLLLWYLSALALVPSFFSQYRNMKIVVKKERKTFVQIVKVKHDSAYLIHRQGLMTSEEGFVHPTDR